MSNEALKMWAEVLVWLKKQCKATQQTRSLGRIAKEVGDRLTEAALEAGPGTAEEPSDLDRVLANVWFQFFAGADPRGTR